MGQWDDIVAECGEAVWRTAWRLLGNHAEASDCFQETFLSALEVARRQTVRNWAGMLQRLATRRALDQLRRRKRQKARATDLADWSAVAGRPDDEAGRAGELSLALREALAEIPPRQAEAFVLRHIEAMSYRQIARAMGVSIPAAGVLVHRARRRLQRRLAVYQPQVFRPETWRCGNEPAPE